MVFNLYKSCRVSIAYSPCSFSVSVFFCCSILLSYIFVGLLIPRKPIRRMDKTTILLVAAFFVALPRALGSCFFSSLDFTLVVETEQDLQLYSLPLLIVIKLR